VKAKFSSSPFIGAISTRASDNPSQGHYYWTYRAIQESQVSAGLDIPSVIGSKESNVEFIEPFFSGILSSSEFKVNPWLPFAYKLGKLSRLIEERRSEGLQSYFSYDGGLADFLVLFWLAVSNPQVHFTFNFHWAEQWTSLLDSKKISARLTQSLLCRAIHSKPANLRLSAETKPFAERLRSIFGVGFDVFPIFSATYPKRLRQWNDRSFDILFLPQRRTELNFVARASALLSKNGLSVITALKPETWQRWSSKEPSARIDDPVFLPVSAEEYEELLQSSRIVVLPYDKPYFQWGSSGKFNEAIAHGCFPIAPRGTAITSQSSGTPSNHEFTYPEEASILSLVTQVLADFPKETLTPVLVQDFLRWMKSPEIHQSDRSSSRQIAVSLALFFCACLYRDADFLTVARSRAHALVRRLRRI